MSNWEEWKVGTEKLDDDLLWKKAAIRQNEIIDSIQLDDIAVVSSHRSKSCLLPVIFGMVTPGVRLFIRGNFYDWKVSVGSEKSLSGIDCKYLFDPTEKHNSVYFEGFNEDWCYGSYSKNKKKFSVSLPYGALELYAFIKEIRRVAGEG